MNFLGRSRKHPLVTYPDKGVYCKAGSLSVHMDKSHRTRLLGSRCAYAVVSLHYHRTWYRNSTW